MSADQPDLACRHIVELVTDYLEHALPIEVQNQLEQHLVICSACSTFVGQHERLVRALRALDAGTADVAEAQPNEASPEARAKALAVFRQLRRKDEP